MKAANATAAGIDEDLRLFRGGVADGLIAAGDVDDTLALVEEGAIWIDRLSDRLHGDAERDPLDARRIRKWMRRAAPRRRRVMTGVLGLGYHGGGSDVARLLYLGRRTPGTIVELRDTGTTINQQPRVEVSVEVAMSNGAPGVLSAKMLLSRVDPPRVGDHVEVAHDPRSPGTFAFRRVRVPIG